MHNDNDWEDKDLPFDGGGNDNPSWINNDGETDKPTWVQEPEKSDNE